MTSTVASDIALSIVVPVYNGAGTIGKLVDALATLDVPGGLDVVLVNDGSADDSADVCARIAETASIPVTFVDLSRNFGEHNAVVAGLSFAQGAYVITMDDDLQNPPEEVLRLFNHTRDNDLDVTYSYFDQKEHATWRNAGSRFANATANMVLDKPRDLYLSSFRCMSAYVKDAIVRQAGPFPYVDGIIFQVTRKIGTLQVKHLPNAENRRNYTLRRLISVWLRIMVGFSIRPLRVSTVIGLVLTGLGVLGVLMVLFEYFFIGVPIQGWASLMVVTLLFSGVQLTMLGVVGEYLGRLYMIQSGYPRFIVRRVVTAEGDHTPSPSQNT